MSVDPFLLLPLLLEDSSPLFFSLSDSVAITLPAPVVPVVCAFDSATVAEEEEIT